MSPFGETLLAWRLSRGMTQAALAKAARVPRPNLSAIERGDREVTLKTLRALALALDIRPGILADGQPPAENARPLTRARLERIAAAVVSHSSLPDAREDALARQLGHAMHQTIGHAKPAPHLSRAADRAYLQLKTSETPEVVSSLIDRVRVRGRRP